MAQETEEYLLKNKKQFPQYEKLTHEDYDIINLKTSLKFLEETLDGEQNYLDFKVHKTELIRQYEPVYRFIKEYERKQIIIQSEIEARDRELIALNQTLDSKKKEIG